MTSKQRKTRERKGPPAGVSVKRLSRSWRAVYQRRYVATAEDATHAYTLHATKGWRRTAK